MEEVKNPTVPSVTNEPGTVEVSIKESDLGKDAKAKKTNTIFVLINKFKELPSNKRTLILAVLIVVFILAAALIAFAYIQLSASHKKFTNDGYLISQDGSKKGDAIEEPAPGEIKDQESPINGILYTKAEIEALKKKYPLVISVENHVEARPQSGLIYADVVYEFLAEGGITRFVGVFWGNDAKEVGPVRSARKYMVDIVGEYDGLFDHIGWASGTGNANTDAESYIYSTGTKSFLWSGYSWRSTDRVAPHNAYTDTSKLWSQATGKGWTVENYSIDTWKFKNDAKLEERPLTSVIEFDFGSTDNYAVRWTYDRNANVYKRECGGTTSIDKVTGIQLETKTLIVQEVVKNYPTPRDSSSRIILDVIGSGNVVVFRDGKYFTGTWRKDSRTARTKFYDQDGNEIELNRGKVWVEMIPVYNGKVEGTFTYN